MNKIKILILTAFAAFAVNALLGEGENGLLTLDTLLTLIFLGYIGYALRRVSQSDSRKKGAPATKTGATRAPQVIHHKPPWSVVARGRTVGRYQNTPIPAWIKTSDDRKAVYAGLALAAPPEECACVEIPERSELILPPGLLYAIQTS